MESNEVVKSSDITIRVGLNAEQVPVKIEWGASDRNNGQLEECKAMAVALFDKDHRDTLRNRSMMLVFTLDGMLAQSTPLVVAPTKLSVNPPPPPSSPTRSRR